MNTSGTPDASAAPSACEPESPSVALAAPDPDNLFPVGGIVRLAQRPPYLKSADPMPMLRPPDLIGEGETGRVVEVRSLELRAVRFRRGTFLINASQLRSEQPVEEQA